MKRIIAVLALIALLVSFTGVPVSAAAINPPAFAGRGDSDPLRAVQMAVPEGAKPMAAATLDEALNVPGGTLEFSTFSMPSYGFYDWVVEEDYAKSNSAGHDGGPENPYGPYTQSQVSTWVDFGEDQAISFRFRVSCQDAEEADYFALFVDQVPAGVWYGEVDWTTFSFPVSTGEHQLTWVYNKDASISEGEDTAYLDDVEVVPFQRYNPVHAPELDEALNVPGGTLEFYTPEEAANGYFPWEAVEEGYARSTNQGIDAATSYSPPSISTVYTMVDAKEGDVLTFRYKVSSEKKMDLLRFYLDGERLESWSGEVDWATFILALEAGPHELRWEYDKDYSGSQMEDTGCLDDVCVAAPVAATGVEMQETASVAGYRTVQLTWNVLPDTAFNRDVTFTSSDEAIATVNEMGQVTGVSQGEATITVTTKDGGFTDTCLVTVTPDEPPVNLYGFIWAQFADDTEGYYREPNTWGSFTDTNPKDAKILGQMPAGDGVQEGTVVLCAELVGDTVYGYTKGGYFFTMDFEAMEQGTLGNVEYKRVNVTGYEDFYPTEMAYDYSTGTMYIINMLGVLYEVDLETGDLDLDSARVLDGVLPGAPSGVSDYACGFAIDLDGNAYIMIVGIGMSYGGNGCSRLAKLDLETGEYTVVGQTTAECYQEQSMCFDHNSGRLYWAQFNTIYDVSCVQLFIVDTETAELTDCGRITEFGAEVLGMFIPICEHSELTAVEAKAPTCTESGNPAYYHCENCGKNFYDDKAIEEAPVEELTLPALGHKLELRNAKEATCTEDGYTGDEVCTTCGEIVKRGEVIPAHCPSKAFADLNTDRWYHEYTDYVIARELMNGMDETHFAPEGNLTRGQLVTTLYRLAGEPEVAEPATFSDVKAGRYYTEAVAWGEDLGIVKGMTDDTFSPEGTVTREQAATFLYRYVTNYLKQEPGQGADLKAFADGGKVQDYAKTAMSWAVAEGFFEGYGDGTLRPRASLTRAQMAKLLTILDREF